MENQLFVINEKSNWVPEWLELDEELAVVAAGSDFNDQTEAEYLANI